MFSRATKRLPDPAQVALEPIAEHPEYRAVLAELEKLEARLAQSLERRKRARARIMGAKPGRPWGERAADLVKGGYIDPSDPADDVAASFEEEVILREGIIAKTEQLDSISRDLSFDASEKFQPLHDQALCAVLTAVDDLSSALEAAAAVRARLRAGGYRPSGTLLPQIEPEGASLLRSSAAVGNSPAWYFKRELQRRGIL